MMESHRQAEELAAKAAAALAEGRKSTALELYSGAAVLERSAFEETPTGKSRTRSILAVSFVSLLYKARRFDEAELAIFSLLASQELLPWADLQIRELLEVVADERFIHKRLGQQYTGDSVTVSLRGGEIGAGTGPLDLILEKASGFKNLFYRFAEFVGDYPLRLRGVPPRDLLDLLKVRATQPGFGSYRLEIKLAEPEQMDFLDKPAVRPPEVVDTLFNVLHAITSGEPGAVEAIIPSAEYRKALLQLIRNVAPTGRRISEIGIYRGKGGEAESVYLTKAFPERIRRLIPIKPKTSGAEYKELRGVLRAVHLDENWLEVILPGEIHEKCDTLPDMLDDVVGPMVNHEVIVLGSIRAKQGGVQRLLVEEIQLAEPD